MWLKLCYKKPYMYLPISLYLTSTSYTRSIKILITRLNNFQNKLLNLRRTQRGNIDNSYSHCIN
jgi:hypothetical protein